MGSVGIGDGALDLGADAGIQGARAGAAVGGAAGVGERKVAFAAPTQIVSDERYIWDRTIGVGCLSRRSTRGLVGHFAVARHVGGKSSRLQQMRGKSSVTG